MLEEEQPDDEQQAQPAPLGLKRQRKERKRKAVAMEQLPDGAEDLGSSSDSELESLDDEPAADPAAVAAGVRSWCGCADTGISLRHAPGATWRLYLGPWPLGPHNYLQAWPDAAAPRAPLLWVPWQFLRGVAEW